MLGKRTKYNSYNEMADTDSTVVITARGNISQKIRRVVTKYIMSEIAGCVLNTRSLRDSSEL